MQGFNKYYPPDYDGEKHGSLNAYRGKHALGDRARKLDQGILITRFELPYNIWCGTCNNHIGMGVRYNAEKKKVGSYYSTPIYSFRCKCHLCDGWFEIQTDPKNTRYVITSGARKKDEDWDPEENGGFAIHDTDAKPASADPLAALEKSTDAQNNLVAVQIPRLESLYNVSDHYNSDPYAISVKIRKRFRKEKKVEQMQKKADDDIRDRYGLPESLRLVVDDQSTMDDAKQQWEQGRQERRHPDTKRQRVDTRIAMLPSSRNTKSMSSSSLTTPSPSTKPLEALRARILENTARQSNSVAATRRRPPNGITNGKSK